MKITRELAAAALLLVLPASAAAQQRTCGPEGRGYVVPDLGWTDWSCDHCSINLANGVLSYTFRSEPRIRGIQGPGEGRLRENDVLVAVDGELITASGARRLAAMQRGEEVRLTVRRDGRTRDVGVRAGERCMVTPRAPRPPAPPRAPHAAAPPAVPRPPHGERTPGAPPRAPQAPRPVEPHRPATPRAPLPPEAPVPPAPPEFLPDGWFGFGISCDECGFRSTTHGDPGDFFFGSAPVVESVEPGTPAAAAGLRRGDRLTHVDGMALTTRQGAARFGSIQPGETVTWTYTRGGRQSTVRATAARRPDARRAGSAPRAPEAARRLRWSGEVDGTRVEVRGAPVTVTRDERTGETIIRSAELTVVLKP
jgi:PDZ domain